MAAGTWLADSSSSEGFAAKNSRQRVGWQPTVENRKSREKKFQWPSALHSDKISETMFERLRSRLGFEPGTTNNVMLIISATFNCQHLLFFYVIINFENFLGANFRADGLSGKPNSGFCHSTIMIISRNTFLMTKRLDR